MALIGLITMGWNTATIDKCVFGMASNAMNIINVISISLPANQLSGHGITDFDLQTSFNY